MNKSVLIIILAAVAVILCVMVAASMQPDDNRVPREGDDITPTDYSAMGNWMKTGDEKDMPTDVFVLYPTTYHPGPNDPLVASIDDEGMRAGAQDFLQHMASAFNTAGNVFAPYYRQLDATWTLTQSPEDRQAYTNGVPKTDAMAAFDYYMQNFNEGRPFILVGHSQGSTVTKEILFDYMSAHPDVYGRMIAAYVLGYSVTQEELDDHEHLRFATGADDVGVIISYNTVSDSFEGELATHLPGSIAINPISWTLGTGHADKSEGLGAWLDRGNGYEKVQSLIDATVDVEMGLVRCSNDLIEEFGMPEPTWDVFPRTSFHGQDISFYYFDLRHNAEVRVAKFLAND